MASFYCWNGERLKVSDDIYILWNECLKEHNNFLNFTMASEGLPDIEIHVDDKCTIVEVTIGQHPQTIVNGLRELVRHKPRIRSGLYARILLTLLPKRDIIEINKCVKHIAKDTKCVIRLLHKRAIITIDKFLQELEAIGDYLHGIIQHIGNEAESKLKIAEILEHEMEITRKCEELVSRDIRVLGSIILKVYRICKTSKFK